VRARLQLFLDAAVMQGLEPLFKAERAAADDAELRGVLHRLMEQAGLAPGAQRAPIAPPLRAKLKALGVRAGRFALFMPALLKPRPARLRAILLAVRAGIKLPPLPAEGRISIPAELPEGMPPGFLGRLGWIACGPILLRLDIAERVAGELGWLTRRRPTALPPDLASRLSVRAELLPQVLPALDVRLLPDVALPEGTFGPPAPPMLTVRGQQSRSQHRNPRPQRRAVVSAPAAAEPASAGPVQTGPAPVEAPAQAAPPPRSRPTKPPARPAPPPRPAPRPINPDSPFAVLAGLRFGR
jgi:ATP-dependent RNA helicase SUPV3L1/SUV3